MGVDLAPIMVRKPVKLRDLAYRTIAVDAYNELHQFLALIRGPDGTPLQDEEGNITSHLNGLLFRTTRLIYEHGIRPVFVFDGPPPVLKAGELEKRRKVREEAVRAWRVARERGDYAKAYSKAVVTGRLTRPMKEDAKHLLALLGIPYVQAPSEGEAQAARMAIKGDVWASASRDYDSVLFGAPRLIRYLTISGSEFLPSRGVSRPLKPELVELESLVRALRMGREQLIDLAILVGTDFNEGVRGIGPKKALNLIKKHGSIEALPGEVKSRVAPQYEEVRRIFLQPLVTDDYDLIFKELREDELYDFLCEQRGFSKERVGKVVERMKGFTPKLTQAGLEEWFG